MRHGRRHARHRRGKRRGKRPSGPGVRHLAAPTFLAEITPEGYPINLSSFGFNFGAGVSPAADSLAVLCIANSLTATPTGGNGALVAGGLTWSALGTIPDGQRLYRMEVFAAIAAGGALSGTFERPAGGGNFDDIHISLFEFPDYGGPLETEDTDVRIASIGSVPLSRPFTAGAGDYSLSCLSILRAGASAPILGPGWTELHMIPQTANEIETWIAGKAGAMSTVDWASITANDGYCLTTVSFGFPN